MSKFLIYEDEDIKVEGELYARNVFLHSFVKSPFTKSLYKDLISIWVEILESLKDKGLEYVYSCIPKDEKIIKWQEMFGMSPLLEREDCLVYRREL